MAFKTLPTFHTLVLIGNGFDLSLGYESSYQHFIKSPEFRHLLNQSNDLSIYLKEKNQIQNWIDVELEFENFAIMHPKRPDYRKLYDEIHQALEKYLNRISFQTTFNQNSPAFELMKQISARGYQIINFNYTKSIETSLSILKADKNDLVGKIVNIHGTLEDRNIIFGVHDSANIGDHTFLKKTIGKGYDPFNLRQKLHEANKIILFGHSLGKTDHQYFKKFFNQLMISEPHPKERKKLTLYHKGEEVRRDLMGQINTLVDGNMLDLGERMEIIPINVE